MISLFYHVELFNVFFCIFDFDFEWSSSLFFKRLLCRMFVFLQNIIKKTIGLSQNFVKLENSNFKKCLLKNTFSDDFACQCT